MNLKGKTVAVTGASGMIGVYLCRSLLAAGAHVVGVVRNPAKAAFLADEGVEFRRADLTDAAALEAAFRGCHAVISNAAMYVATKGFSAWHAHEKANVEGTRNVFEAAHRAGVKRIVHVSTFGIYRWSITRPMDENWPQLDGKNRKGGTYRATKQISEDIAWQLARELDLQLTTVRPSGVYGARDPNTMELVYKALRLPVLVMPSIGFPLVYAGDVADATVQAVANDGAINQAYNLGGEGHQLSTFLRAVVRARGKGPRIASLPLPIKIRTDNSKAERELGFRNRPFDEALKQVVAEEGV
ncbi:MAG: SDR family NAD(P)-dependent oxidoreductase [Marinobacter sp.]|uniref:NAD-dependent epimerase/dehydratase family protein n=1 Tax=Marinobacter sp. TaxID=50741 RepID=UPI0029C2A77B|nr:SDR family NAD(P)-dependent oxidoreductase [Marinobacter sp.]MDX5385556.1 SDR family NAD(P)-dependent oxidoreductase [Marinobacter sp.]